MHCDRHKRVIPLVITFKARQRESRGLDTHNWESERGISAGALHMTVAKGQYRFCDYVWLTCRTGPWNLLQLNLAACLTSHRVFRQCHSEDI